MKDFTWKLEGTKQGIPYFISTDIWTQRYLAETYGEKGLYSRAVDEYEFIIASLKAPGIQKRYFPEEVKKRVR